MAESGNFGALGLVLLGLAFVGTAILAAYYGHLWSEKVFEGTFAAAAEAAFGVFVVGIVVRWYQWRASIREEKMAVLRELSRIREKVREANFLMTAHESAKTWTEQTRELVRLVDRITDLQEAASRNGPTQMIRTALDNAKKDLEKLQDEYRRKHGDVAKLGTQWDAILDLVPESKKLVVSDQSPLVDALSESIRLLKQELHR
ncbi:MAG TPA: hypothetical protein VMT20_10255 [Terriglobia bacterium]|nr:hypothetical protein [Terriglobia bacterium]